MLLNQTLLNISRNYIPNKNIKWDYQPPQWITDKTKKFLKDLNWQKIFTEIFRGKVIGIMCWKNAECTREILEAKKQYILKLANKLEDVISAPKNYWL